MTFLEAAIEVLRDATEPLHFSEIAKRAVEQKLLSHVGRDPEAAMRGCLVSAVRGEPDDALVRRAKPAHYEIMPGAKLPDRPEPAPEPEPHKAAKKKAKKKTARKRGAKAAEGEADVARPAAPGSSESSKPDEPNDPAAVIEFEAPTGSGLSGPTDVALVMANAMSRIVDERPELKTELEAMQAQAQPKAEEPDGAGPTVERRTHRGRTRVDGDESEDRGGRKRRRRRRRNKKVEWRGGSEPTESVDASVLDSVARVLAEAGPRSLHIRQIAEQLAAQNVGGGEISELERAITTAIVVDVHRQGDGSRFAMRGDARYQLRGSRVPAGAAKAETALYAAAREAERATRTHLRAWLSVLGARGFESLVRAYLDSEGYTLVHALAQVRGLGRLVVQDPDPEEGRVLVLAIPSKTPVDRKLWEGEMERNECSSVMVIAAAEETAGDWGADVRLLPGPWFSAWLAETGIGVRRVQFSVPVLDPEVIESIGGLDT